MPIFESCMTILGATSGIATLHGWFTGLKAGDQIEQIMNQQAEILNRQNATKAEVEKLSERIYYADLEQVQNISGTSEKINDRRNLREILDPV